MRESWLQGSLLFCLQPPTSNLLVLLAACAFLLSLAGCAQQSDLVKQDKEMKALIAKTRTDLDQSIGETRARFNQELATLREEELPALRGNLDKGANRFDAVQRRLDDIENKTTARLNVLEKIQLEQANLLKADRDRVQGELAKMAETLGALAKTVDAKLDAHDKTIAAQSAQVTQLSLSLVDLSAKVDTDRKVTTEHLAEVNKSVNSVSKALRKVGEAIETREAEQDRRLDETAKAVQRIGEAAETREADQSRRLEELAKALQKIADAVQTRDAEQNRRLDEMAKALHGKAAPPGKVKNGKPDKGGKQPPQQGAPAGTSPAKDAAPKAAAEGASSESEDKSYEQSLQVFKAGDYRQAQARFSDFLQRYPESKLAPNAQYWLGECYYGAKDYAKAIDAFDRVQGSYPDSAKVPAALLKKGFAYAALKDGTRASSTLKQIVETYPRSPEAVMAKQKLAQLP